MKKVLAVLILLSLYWSGYAQQKDSDTKEPPSKIVLPDIKLTIEDESEMPLFSNEKDLLSETTPDAKRVDIEELATTKVSERIKLELMEDRKKESFSLSTFKLYYGSFQNLIIDFNFGKSLGELNYLITYLRNKRDSLGYMGTNYFNTELALDDLNLDFIYGVGDTSDLNATFGYYERSIGLHSSPVNISEQKLHLPVKINLLYHGENNYKVTVGTYMDYLALSHKSTTTETLKELWETGLNAKFEANWSRDNFLKTDGDFHFSSLLTNQQYEGGLNLVARFTILRSLALELGGGLRLYTYKSLFIYPDLALIYKYSQIFNLKAGITGGYKKYDAEAILGHNQIDLTQADPEEKNDFRLSINFSPVKFATLRSALSYQVYHSYLNISYSGLTDLYSMQNLTNVNVLESETILEFMFGERLALNMSYRYRLPSRDDLLFFAPHTASILLEYKNQESGTEISTKVNYKDIEQVVSSVYQASAVIWDASFSQSLTPEIFLDLKVNNILNQNDYEKSQVPKGGFSINGGIRILL